MEEYCMEWTVEHVILPMPLVPCDHEHRGSFCSLSGEREKHNDEGIEQCARITGITPRKRADRPALFSLYFVGSASPSMPRVQQSNHGPLGVIRTGCVYSIYVLYKVVVLYIQLDDNNTRGTYQFFRGQGRVVANDIVDADAHGKGHSPLHYLASYFLCIELVRLSLHDGRSELAQVDNLGAGHALAKQTLQAQIHNLAGLLVLGTHVAATLILAVIYTVRW